METVNVNAEILIWARESAGLSVVEATKKLGFKDSKNKTAEEKLKEIELGIEKPSRNLLLKMAKQYHRPLITFYLESPPTKENRGEDFRNLSAEYDKVDQNLVDALVRDIRARQQIVLAALQDEDEATPLEFVNSTSTTRSVKDISLDIKKYIKFDLAEFRKNKSNDLAFNYLRNLIEAAGVYTLLIGNLGSHHSNIPLEAFRGFSLADKVAPFIVINDQDSKAACSFTLLHELAHIWLGQTGISGMSNESRIEQFCNDVAGEILIPKIELSKLDIANKSNIDEIIEEINLFAKLTRTSRSMIAYHLFRADLINLSQWKLLATEFKNQWKNSQKGKKTKSGGPDYYLVKRYKTGKALINLVSRLSHSGVMSATKAGKVLGVNPRNVFELMQAA